MNIALKKNRVRVSVRATVSYPVYHWLSSVILHRKYAKVKLPLFSQKGIARLYSTNDEKRYERGKFGKI